MQKKLKNLTTLVLLGAVILGFCAWSVLKTDETLSVSERRNLTQFPELSTNTLLSGRFMTNFESYTLDQFPLRDSLRSLKAFTALRLLGQSDTNGVYDDGGYLAKLDFPLDTASVDNAAERFTAVYDRYLAEADCKVYLSIVPDKNYYTDAAYPKLDYAALTERLTAAMPWATSVDLSGALSLESYYRTDPHWRQEALADAARLLAQGMGTELTHPFETVELSQPFYGAYCGQIALSQTPDTLRYLTNDILEACRLYNYETQSYSGLYDEAALESNDLYDFFLYGSRSLLTVENPNAQTDRELVIFRDSYGSSIAPLLAEGYARITLVDIRYLSPELLSRYLTFENQDVLFLYSTSVLNSSNALR